VLLIEKVLPVAHARLITIGDNATLVDAARLLSAGHDLVVVCSATGSLVGVITKTDIVGQISHCEGYGCTNAVSSVMTRDVVLCRSMDGLSEVWSIMKDRGLKNVPIMNEEARPVGVLNARDALEALLEEAEDEELLFRDYVMGIGYR
jgi:CBS domain-containing protein